MDTKSKGLSLYTRGFNAPTIKPSTTNQGNTIMTLWKYNKVTGYWVYVRGVTPETQKQWLDIYMQDEPDEMFKVSNHKPTNKG
jgi:hypothetical protein